MKSVNARIEEDYLAWAIDLERLQARNISEVKAFLSELREEIVAALLKHEILTPSQKVRFKTLLESVDATIATAYTDIRKTNTRYLIGIAEMEAAQLGNAVNAALKVEVLTTVLTPEKVKAIASDTLVQGAPSKKWWKLQSDGLQRSFEHQIRMGMGAGESIQDMVRRVRGTATGRRNTYWYNGKRKVYVEFAGGIMDIGTRQAEALVRTSALAVANAASEETFKANKSFIKGKRTLATLDLRTSAICRLRDGWAWDMEGNPMPETGARGTFPGPPAWHWNSVIEGTLVTTANGERPIQDIRAGERVLTHTGKFKRVMVTMRKANEGGTINRLVTSSGDVLLTTDEHPVLIVGEGWKCASDVQVGDKVFKYSKQPSKARFSSSTLQVPYNYKPLFDQQFIPYEVTSTLDSVHMGFAVELKNNLFFNKKEVDNVLVDDMLERSSVFNKVQNRLFPRSRVLAEVLSLTMTTLNKRFLGAHWVRVSHPYTLAKEALGIFFRKAVGTMVGSARVLITRAGWCRDSVFFKAPLNSTITVPVFFGNFGNRKPVRDILLDESLFVGGCDVRHWNTPDVIDISTVPYTGTVYNLGVETDNSFVADGVVVHNCRSRLVPITYSWEELATKNKALARKLDRNVSESTRASMDGQVSEKLVYEDWLRDQSEARQLMVLGPTKHALWKKGALSFRDMASQTGNEISLEQLRNTVLKKQKKKLAKYVDKYVAAKAKGNEVAPIWKASFNALTVEEKQKVLLKIRAAKSD